jgi:hypothetical protein
VPAPVLAPDPPALRSPTALPSSAGPGTPQELGGALRQLVSDLVGHQVVGGVAQLVTGQPGRTRAILTQEDREGRERQAGTLE